MVIRVHLALLQVYFLGVECTRYTMAKQKHNVFDKNSVGRLSMGFGKRVSELQRGEEKNSGKTNTEMPNADNTALFNDIVDRLSYGYGKRAMHIYKTLQAQGMNEFPKRTTLGTYAEDDILRQRLIDILVKNIKQNPDLAIIENQSYDQEDIPTELYDDYQNSIKDWIEIMAEN